MAPLKILICGGGCAGPALAFWLARTGHHVVVVERFPALRATGAQVDLREQGINVAKRMGLIDAIRAKLVDEDGVAFVDSNGTIRGKIMANRSGRGAQSITSEYEIMRGDLVRVLYEKTKDRAEYVFGKTVERFEQDPDKVTAYFSDGSSDTYDLLVGADGLGSRIRKAILPPDAPSPYRGLGIYIAYWFIPRAPQDDNIRRTYHSPGGRMIFRRTHSPTESHVYFFLKDDSEELRSLPKAPVDQQKAFWTERFRDAGWESERFLDGLQKTDNFYCIEAAQVHIDKWYKGRVVLLGDAAHCPSPFSGMGTTAGFVGAYVLAGEINRNADNLELAFENYDKTLRPFVDAIQEIKPWLLKLFIPDSAWAIALIHFVGALLCLLRIPQLMAMFSSEEKGGWKVPDYPELRQIRTSPSRT